MIRQRFNTGPVLFFLSIIMATSMLSSDISLAADHQLPEGKMTIRFDLEKHLLSGVSQITLPAGQGLELYLYMVTVDKVVLNHKELPLTSIGDRLSIQPQPDSQEILVNFERQWPTADSFNIIDENFISLTELWHPVSDREMLYTLTAIIPERFSAVSEAEEILSFPDSPEQGLKQVIFRFPHPLQTLHFVAGPYIMEEETFGNGKILASYFFAEDQHAALEYRQQARRFLERFEALLGPYPYQRFAVVENRLPTGFAMPTFTLLGQAVLRLPFIKDTSLGHEILHQWFGNSVAIDMSEGNWAEGLTAYLADQAFAAEKGQGMDFRKEQLIKYQSYISSNSTLSLAKFTGADDQSEDRNILRAVGYSKASMFFHMLKKTLGEELFLTGLRDFYKRFQFRQAGWSDLLASFETVSELNLKPLFEQWLTRTDIPHLTVKEEQVWENDGQPVVTFQLVQLTAEPYQLTVPLVIRTTGEDVRQLVTITSQSTAMAIPLTGQPLELIIDEDYDLMRVLAPEELPPTWSRFEGAQGKLAIFTGEELDDRFAPFAALVESMNGRVVNEKEVTQADLAANALLFFGVEGKTSRSLFDLPHHQAAGVTVDIRNNPLDPAQVAVLLTVENRDEAAPVAAKLKHYGKYSFLRFAGGRNLDKQVAVTDNGLRFTLDEMPAGMRMDAAQSFAEIMKSLLKSRVIYVGEIHTSYADHILQLKIIRALHAQDPNLAVGMEMFNRATQPVLDDFINHRIDEKTFLKQSDYFGQWSFDYRLYRDILNFAARYRLPVIGLNIDRDITSNIFRENGTDGLSAEEKDSLVEDRDLDLPGYRERITAVFRQHGNMSGPMASDENVNGFLQAQALWDESMAEAIADYLRANTDMRMVVIAGGGHTHKETAIPPRVKRRLPIQQTVVMNVEPGVGLEPAAADYLFFSPDASLPPAPLLGVMLEETKDESGARIIDFSPQGQASNAGLRKNDTIIAINGEPIATINDVRIVMTFAEGSAARVKIRREHNVFPDEELEVEVPFVTGRKPHQPR